MLNDKETNQQPLNTKGVFNENYYQLIREQAEIRIKEAKEKLGDKWICHANNKIQRKVK